MSSVFFEITLIICLVSVLTIILRFLKQPPILAYILAGIIIGPFGQLQLHNQDVLKTMGEFGIALLLFTLGLELKLSHLRTFGKTALVIGLNQIVFTWVLGYFLSLFLGFSETVSFYIGVALTFSSTIIIVKLLADKRDATSLYGKLLVGLLLVQDFAAIFILMLLSGFKSANGLLVVSWLGFLIIFIKGISLISLITLLSKFIFPRLIHRLARSQETLFLFSLAWVFALSFLVSSPLIGFSVAIGGFLAGLSLAEASENYQIAAQTKTLRDFFIVIFFVTLGMEMGVSDFSKIWLPMITFSLFVVILKPLIISTTMALFGFRKRTSFLTAVHTGQISEFSLVIIFLGGQLGHLPKDIISLVTGVGIVTFVLSAYIINNAKKIQKIFGDNFCFFEIKGTKKEEFGHTKDEIGELKNHVVMVGANRLGQSILNSMPDLEEKLVVVDFDPDVVSDLKEKNIMTIFGDITDIEIQERVAFGKAKLVISTVPDFEENISLIQGIKRHNKDTKIIVVSYDTEDADELYKAGADYVVLPHLAGGRHVARILKEDNLDETITAFKAKDLLLIS